MHSEAESSEPRERTPLYRLAQQWLLPALTQPGYAIDATCGNGNDLLFLCESMGSSDEAIGIDKQAIAIENTREKLATAGFHPNLFHSNHSEVCSLLTEYRINPVKAAIFNLGYLPGGDHAVITKPESTIAALRAIVERTTSLSRIAVVAYRGHPGGRDEASAVRTYLASGCSPHLQFSELTGKDSEISPHLYRLGPSQK